MARKNMGPFEMPRASESALHEDCKFRGNTCAQETQGEDDCDGCSNVERHIAEKPVSPICQQSVVRFRFDRVSEPDTYLNNATILATRTGHPVVFPNLP